MKHFHKRIRRDGAILYAKKHPEVRLEDIALALGIPAEKAKISGRSWSMYGHLKRPGGGKSPAFDFAARTAKMREYYDSKKFDHTQLQALLAEGRGFRECGEILKRNPVYLADVARKHGYR